MIMIPALLTTLFAVIVYWKTSMKLNKFSASLLIASYIVYLGYMGYVLNDKYE